MTDDLLPLYVHIPYCRSKCDYCDFFSVAEALSFENDEQGRRDSKKLCNERGVPDKYITALINEILAVQRERHCKWQSVYIGGGTPSIMSLAQIKRLFNGIWQEGYQPCTEVTFEANPKDVTVALLETLKECKVTRISCGFQSFTDNVLRTVHRTSTAKDEERALDVLRSWHGIFSADMMAGLPEDTDAALIKGLSLLKECGAKHISLYTLTIEENTPLARRIKAGNAKGYDADKADMQWLLGRDELLKLGYEQYEVSNFAYNERYKNAIKHSHGQSNSFHCLHNEAYWKMADYAGCGAGAVSSFYGQGASAGTRYTNTQDIDKYLGYYLNHWSTKNAPRQTEILDTKTQQFEFFMLGLRLSCGVSEYEYKARFGCSIDESILLHFAQWEENALAKKYSLEGQTYHALTKEGLLLLNRFLQEI